MDELAKKRFLVKDPRKEKLSLEDVVNAVINLSEDLHKIELADNLDAARRSASDIRKVMLLMDEFRDRVIDIRNEIIKNKM